MENNTNCILELKLTFLSGKDETTVYKFQGKISWFGASKRYNTIGVGSFELQR